MESEFVTYCQAVAIKELGFNGPCFSLYFPDGVFSDMIHSFTVNSDMDKLTQCIKAPLKQQVVKWFRDTHQLYYTIEINCSQLSFEWGFDYTIYDKGNDKWLSTEPQNCPPGETTYVTYEEAESACIDKLIELIKNK